MRLDIQIPAPDAPVDLAAERRHAREAIWDAEEARRLRGDTPVVRDLEALAHAARARLAWLDGDSRG